MLKNLMERPLVSIITPMYNSGRYIATTIEFIIGQSYQNWELLITDDASTDDSVRIVEDYIQKDNRIKLFRLHANAGAAAARNNSIKMARGRFIAFCDSDDIWLPEKLEKQISFMIEQGYAFTHTSYICMDNYWNYNYAVHCKKIITRFSLLCDDSVGTLTAIYDTSILGKLYMPTIKHGEDFGLWLSIVRKTVYIYGIDEFLALYRNRAKSLSSKKLELLKYNYQIYHQVEGWNSIISFTFLLFIFLPFNIYKKSCRFFHRCRKKDREVFNTIKASLPLTTQACGGWG
jgi:glycosyltransferase involved in cell wall biosynthesis